MKWTLRKSEREAIQEALVQERGSVAEAATAVWNASLEEFLKREFFVLLVVDPKVSPIPFVHGLFPTANAANAAIKNGEVFAASGGVRAVVVRLKSRDLDCYQAEEAEGLW